MINRRSLLAGAGIVSMSGCPALAQQASSSVGNQFGFLGPENDPEFGALIRGAQGNPVATVASGHSRHSEVATAFKLIFDAPYNSDHIAVAQYFSALKEKNADNEPYNAEWKVRSNPLIVGFFSLTNTLPNEGDQTHWCAAFVNFCLYAAGKTGTYSAMSGSFRKFGVDVEKDLKDQPRRGDIAVFRKWGPDGVKGHGHVGFLLSVSADGKTFNILGGNQVGKSKTTGAVIPADFERESESLELFGFRRITS